MGNGLFYSVFSILAILAILVFLVFFVLIFVWNIPRVWGEVTGRSSARRVRRLKELSSKSSSEYSTSDIFNIDISSSDSLDDELDDALGEEDPRTKLSSLLGRVDTEETQSAYAEVTAPMPIVKMSGLRRGGTAGLSEPVGIATEEQKIDDDVSLTDELFGEDLSTGIFDDGEVVTEDWDGSVFSHRRSVIVLQTKTNLN